MVISPLSTRLIKPNFCFDLSHRRSTTVSLETRNSFQSLLTFPHCAGEKNILQTVLLPFFSVFIFSMPSKVILIVKEFMFLVINMFWALLRLILALSHESESGPKHIYAREHKLYCYILHFVYPRYLLNSKIFLLRLIIVLPLK